MIFLWIIIIYCLSLAIYGFLINKYWERKLREKARLIKETEAQLIQMEKMASLGLLAAGIAHEINNPLSFLVSNLESLRDYVQKLIEGTSLETLNNKALAEDLKSMTQESLEGALRIKKIVQDLRTFSRRSETNKVLVDINQVLESTLSIVWNEIKYKAILIKDYQAKSEFLAEPTQLSQVFLNILINAGQAISEKGTISLSTYEDAENVYIKISDTGCGIPPEILTKIFDPFFSTKKSAGLGLSVSYNIIKRNGGDIKAESKAGCGTTVTIRLPKNTIT